MVPRSAPRASDPLDPSVIARFLLLKFLPLFNFSGFDLPALLAIVNASGSLASSVSALVRDKRIPARPSSSLDDDFASWLVDDILPSSLLGSAVRSPSPILHSATPGTLPTPCL